MFTNAVIVFAIFLFVLSNFCTPVLPSIYYLDLFNFHSIIHKISFEFKEIEILNVSDHFRMFS